MPSDFAHRQCCRHSAQVLLRPQQHASLKCVPQALSGCAKFVSLHLQSCLRLALRHQQRKQIFAFCQSPLQKTLGRFPNNDATTKLDQLWMFNLDFDTNRRRRGGTTSCHGFVEIGAAARSFVRPRLGFRFLFIVSHAKASFVEPSAQNLDRVRALFGSSLILMSAWHTRSACAVALNARI